MAQSSISKWMRVFANVEGVKGEKDKGAASGSRRPEDWSPHERLRALEETSKLNDAELGEYLRREGLHEETLATWRAAALQGLGPTTAPRAKEAERKRIAKLERELARKEKALAAANALLELQKKVQAIWADAESDTDEESDE